MQRSITKTRGELERITYKINQLKNKYITEGNAHMKLDKSLPGSPEKQQIYGRSPMATHSNIYNEVRPKDVDTNSNRDFKMFKNEIYQYIDKCFMGSREKDHDLIPKSRRSKDNDLQSRVRKIEQELTSCLDLNQQISVQLKKKQKKGMLQFEEIQEKITKEVAKESLKLQIQIKEKLSSMQKSLTLRIDDIESKQAEKSQVKSLENIILEVEGNMMKLVKDIKESFRINDEEVRQKFMKVEESYLENIEKLSEEIDQIREEIKSSPEKEKTSEELSISDQINYIKEQIANFEISLMENSANEPEIAKQSQKNKVEEIITEMYETLEENLRKQISGSISEIREQLNNFQMKTETEEELANFSKEFYDQIKVLEKEMKQISESQKGSNSANGDQNINQITEYVQQEMKKNQQKYGLMLTEKVELIISKVEEIREFGKTREKANGEKIREQADFYEKQSMKMKEELEMKIEESQKIFNEIFNQLEVKIAKVEESVHQNKNSMKVDGQEVKKQVPSLPIENLSSKQMQLVKEETLILVDEKLNQFETDINETLKLLYDDFETKNQELFSKIDLEQLQLLKEEISELKRKMDSLKQLQSEKEMKVQKDEKDEEQPCEEISSNVAERIKQQMYEHMGESIQKLSMVLERTVEEIETKMERLDQNFNYIYEKLSGIEFDNAIFKGKLESFQQNSQSKEKKIEEESQKQEENKDDDSQSLINMFGTFNVGGGKI